MSRSLALPAVPKAAVAAGLSLFLLGLEYVLATPDEDALRQFLVVSAIIAVGTAIVFGLVVPRASSARTGLVLSLIALLFAGVFWTGLPPVLAVGGIVLGRRYPSGRAASWAVAIGYLALAADLAAVIVDGVIN